MIINLSIAFLAGLISFLSPCVLPLIPGYISYISGTTLNKIKEEEKNFIVYKTIFFNKFKYSKDIGWIYYCTFFTSIDWIN